jgi:4-diphosphocytidyl-2-C-methyl-D-erythritol kinase
MLYEKAYAKVNLFLDVLSKREDGYHNIGTLFQTIALYDELWAEVIPDGQIVVEHEHEVDFAPEDDLIYRTALAVQEKYAPGRGIKIQVKKHRPMGAGLGGGSADAAAVLRICKRLWGLEQSWEELEHLGAGLGADVPFLVRGGSALAGGIGEELEFLGDIKSPWITILTPKSFVGTAQAYGRLTPSGELRWQKFREQVRQSTLIDVMSSEFDFFNKFEESVYALDEVIAQDYKALRADAPKGRVLLSGSGASLLVMHQNKAEAEALRERWQDKVRFAGVCQFVSGEAVVGEKTEEK